MSLINEHDLTIQRLTLEYAHTHAESLVKLHNLIPYVTWTAEDLLSSKSGERVFHSKFQLSIAAHSNKDNRPVGLMVAYRRDPRNEFPHPSIYLHRGAMDPALRKQGIGQLLFHHYLQNSTLADRYSCGHITLQTNIEPRNAWLIEWYKRLGFTSVARIRYPEKTDLLMAYRWSP